MSIKRRVTVQILAHGRVPSLLLRLNGARGRLTVLAYHRVYDLGEEAHFPCDPDLVSASLADFAWQMAFVRRHFNVISFAALIESLEAGRTLPPRALIVSFDDGHRDNYECAFPILRRLGVPATIFLSTGYIGGEGTFWFDRVAYLLYHCPQGALGISDIGYAAELSDVSSRRAAAERLLAILKKLPDPARLEVLQQLERLVAAPLGAEHEHSGALTWAQVREMSTAGIEFGSHTVSHPVLSVLDDATLEHELVDSRGVIEARTGKACRILAYPIGATAPRVEAAARQAGYKLGIGYQSGTNRLDRLEPFAIRRLHVERYLSRAYFQSMLALPQVFD